MVVRLEGGGSYKNAAFATLRRDAERVLRALLAAGLLDDARKVRAGEEVLIPVRDHPDLEAWAARLGARVERDADLAPREGRRAPHDEVVELLRGALGPDLATLAPDKWEQHGDVLVLRLPEALLPHADVVGGAYAQVLGLRCVLHDPEGVRGEYREMAARVVWGSGPVATHVENGVKYRFDASRIMFSSGNVAERMRAARLPAKGETVVDMFAGIGYFALPIAVHAGAARVHAIEKNPDSFRYLQENVALNGVERVVSPWPGDNREFPHDGVADRVLMGYVGGVRRFLPKAFALLKPEGGVIHYHDTAHAERWKDEMTRHVLDAARACGTVVAIEDARVVKSYSPGVAHAVLDVRVRRGA